MSPVRASIQATVKSPALMFCVRVMIPPSISARIPPIRQVNCTVESVTVILHLSGW